MSCDVNWIKIQNLLKARNEVGVKKGKHDSECFSKTKESRKNDCGDLRRKRSLEQLQSNKSNETNFSKLSSTAFLKKIGLKIGTKPTFSKDDWEDVNFDVMPAPKILKRDKKFEHVLLNDHGDLIDDVTTPKSDKMKISPQSRSKSDNETVMSTLKRSQGRDKPENAKRHERSGKSKSNMEKVLQLELPTNLKEPTKFVGLDCEMVGALNSGNFSLLARVSIVNSHGHLLYDKFVKPSVDVTDYRTEVSGITAGQLVDKGEPLQTVQKEVAQLLKGRVVVGHALRNDFKVLFLQHPKTDTRDTTLYPPFRKLGTPGSRRPPALRALAEKLLGIQIQTGEHDSVQDAQVAMKLYMKHRGGWEQWLNRRMSKLKSKQKKQKTEDADDNEDIPRQDAEVVRVRKQKKQRLKRTKKRHNKQELPK